MKATWKVAVLYENTEAREAAVAFCDRLVERFWAQVGFDIGWWSFELLAEPGAAGEAAEKAADANLVVFASQFETGLPWSLRAWNETWLARRGEREGTLVELAISAAVPNRDSAAKPAYLRQLAHRGGMDYLTHIPQDLLQPIPESPESCSQRAEQMTSLLDEILHQLPPPAPVRFSA
jgi:hypothetical protein